MKKIILTLGLLLMVAQTNCGIFDTAKDLLKKGASTLFEKGKKYITDNSDDILKTVKDLGGQAFDKALDFAKEKIFGKTKEEADKEEEAIVEEAKDIIQTTPGLTPEEQQALIKEAGELAKKNRVELEKVAMESIAKKRAALKQSMYDKFGKGTPTSKNY